MTEERLKELTAEWQKTLRLQDWDIDVSFKRHFEMCEENVLGQCVSTPSVRKSTIHVLVPEDADTPQSDYNLEETLVHEILHVHFSEWENLFTKGDAMPVSSEAGIDAISHALVALKYKGVKTEQN